MHSSPPDQASANHGSKAAVLLVLALSILYGITYFELIAGKKAFSGDASVWYGTFHYYIEHMKQGIFPYWDPYSLMGTYFYPNISGYGLLDPVCLLLTGIAKLFHVLPYPLFIVFRLYRIAVFIAGAFLLYRYIAKNSLAALIAAGVLLFTVTQQNTSQPMMDYCFTVPLALYCILLLLDTIDTQRRYLYLLSLTLITGITMNVFIPSLYLFNIFFFLLILFISRRYSLKQLLPAIRSRKFLLLTLLCILLTVMMTAPPLSVYLLDTAADGELFAVAKLLDSNHFRLKQMMATEFGGDLFFDRLRKDSGTFLSYGSALSLLYPDLTGVRYRSGTDNPPVVPLYMGIIPLILLGAAFFRGRSSLAFPFLLLAGLVLVGCFSFSDVYSNYNPLQKFMNLMFPPLRMLDTRLNFASLISFYLCLFYCLGVSALMKHRHALTSLSRAAFVLLLLLCLLPSAVKMIITSCYSDNALFVSRHDAVALLLPFAVIGGLCLLRYRLVRFEIVLGVLVLISILDQSAFGVRKTRQLPSAEPMHRFLTLATDERDEVLYRPARFFDGTELYRLPYVPMDLIPSAGFNEIIAETKGAFISNVLSSIFTTKRYYDLFSLLPPEQQARINGLIYPVIRFFPLQYGVKLNHRRELFDYFVHGDVRSFDEFIYLEEPGKVIYTPRAEFNLGDFQDVPWFNNDRITEAYNGLLPLMAAVRKDTAQLLSNDNSTLRIRSVSINDIEISIENRVEGYLQYTDGWSRYWRAYDGEKELPIMISNYNSKSILLPQGKHEVRLVFDPRHYKIALILFYAGLLVTTGLLVFTYVKTRSPV
ncbi:MAG: hypothetical protein C0402_10520 [Thermodesulfovibrio sp.]|nr:hypothetical protein [Thermodesulfovibrio sp.]